MYIFDEIEKLTNTTVTNKGDGAYKTTLNKNLDLFSKMGAIRSGNNYYENAMNLSHLRIMFREAYAENKHLALANWIYLRDILSGLGERESFRYILKEVILPIYSNKVEEIIAIIEKYGRWDDSLILLDDPRTEKEYASIIRIKLESEDVENPSLLAKWLPSINTSNKIQVARAKKLARLMGYSEKTYRKTLSKLRKNLNIVERNLTKKTYDNINYSHVPARAMKQYKEAFERNDYYRFDSYLNQLASGEVKAKSDTLYPHEILNQLKLTSDWYSTQFTKDENVIKLAEAQWKAIQRSESDTNTIVVRDGSGSMYGKPLEIADALTILFSESLKGPFKDKFITFSSKPDMVNLTGCETLIDKLSILSKYDDTSNTNIEAVYELILQASLNIPEEERIDRIVIVSDMQFDDAIHDSSSRNFYFSASEEVIHSVFENAKIKFDIAGIKFPEVVFWNVNSYNTGFPASKFDHVKLVGGYSASIMRDIINNESITPNEHMMKVLFKYLFDVNTLVN